MNKKKSPPAEPTPPGTWDDDPSATWDDDEASGRTWDDGLNEKPATLPSEG